MNNRYLNLVGLAKRAGKCRVGEDGIIRDIQRSQAKLVLLTSDIGVQTKKRLTDKCKAYAIPVFIVHETDVLSKAIGSQNRVAVAILDDGFAKGIKELLG